MRTLLTFALFSLGLTGVGLAQQTVVLTSSGSAGGLGQYSDGTAWPVDGGFRFDVGVFPAGFDPAAAERAALIPSWLTTRLAGPAESVDSWFRDGASTCFSITGTSANLRAADLPGSQYYVWGYNTRTVSSAAEWILLTNPAWRVVATDAPLLPDHFDTRDPGTVALVGQLLNGGADLKSERVFTSSLILAGQATNVSVPLGQSATLTVSARGTDLAYQWYVGTKGDVAQPIAGATRASYTVGSVGVTTSYWVRLSNGVQTVDSETMTVSASSDGAGIAVNYEASNLGYISGHRVRVRQEVSYTGTPSRVGLAALLPAGWSFLAGEGPAPQSAPAVGTTDLIEWAWSTLPPSPFSFSYVLVVPPGVTGDHAVTTLATAVRAGIAYQGLAQPDPLAVKPGARWHTADVDRNLRIDLTELTRAIEIYNTRSGTQRTGAYRIDSTSEDGFAPDRLRAAADTVTLASYHSADVTPRDGRLSLTELTRVIELYNFRSGSVRTGAYYARGDTEDGFVTGVTP